MHRTVSFANSGPNYTTNNDPNFTLFQQSGIEDTSFVTANIGYKLVRPLYDDFMASIQKCDVPAKNPHDENFFWALELVWQILAPYLTVCMDFNRVVDINSSAAPGITYKLQGIKDKGEALKSKQYKDKLKRNTVPLSTFNDKREYLPNEDIERRKLRTTACTPIDFIVKTKAFFDEQNENICKASSEEWIQYGMTKQYGGFSRFLRKLEKFTHICESDISGYDRVAFLYWVYYLRWRGCYYPDGIEEIDDCFWHNVYYNIFPTIVLPNGVILSRATGNNSGGNDTASDNSILHLIIKVHQLVAKWNETYNYRPTLEQIEENSFVGIYSDDQLGGINFDAFGWVSVDDYRQYEIDHYSLYGMTVKPSATRITFKGAGTRVPSEHQFLGSFCHYSEFHNSYFPYPRIDKICSSIVGESVNGQLEEEEMFMKILSLTLLSQREPKLFKVMLKYLQYFYHRSKDPFHLRDVMKANGLTLEGSGFSSIWTGRE